MEKIAFALMVSLVAASIGCAFTTVVPAGENTPGFRYFEAKPLLVVTKDSTRVLFVPNPDKVYALRYYAFLSKQEITLKMKEGWWLEEVSDKRDPTELVKGLVAIGEEAIEAGVSAARAASEPVEGDLVGVYEFVFDGEGNIKEMRKLRL